MAGETDQAIDELAAEYLPHDAPESFLKDLMHDDEKLLTYGVLKELRALRQARTGGKSIDLVLDQQEEDQDTQESNLWADQVAITGTREKSEFGFTSKAVLIYGWDQDIIVQFSKTGSNNEIELAASKSSFSIGGDVPLDSSVIYYRLKNDNDPQTDMQIIAQ